MKDDEIATIRGWQQGDEQAVRALFENWYPRAVRTAALSGLAPDEAQDCAQEAFVQAFTRRGQLRDAQAFPLWFHRIVTRHILDALGALRQGKEVPLERAAELTEDWMRQHPAAPDDVALLAERRAALWRGVQQLPPHYRVPVVLRYYGHFSVREVADMLEVREGTLRVTLHRALAQLRASWQHEPLLEPAHPAAPT